VLVALRASATRPGLDPPVLPRSLALIAAGAATLAMGQALALGIELFVLLHDASWPLRAALGTLYVQVSAVRVLAGAALAICALGLQRRGPTDGLSPRLLPPTILLAGALAVAAPWTSHAAARLESRDILVLLDGAHQLAAGIWVGGLPRRTAGGGGRRGGAGGGARAAAAGAAVAGRAAAAVLEPRGGSRHRPRGGRGRAHALLRAGEHRALRHR